MWELPVVLVFEKQRVLHLGLMEINKTYHPGSIMAPVSWMKSEDGKISFCPCSVSFLMCLFFALTYQISL